MNSTKEIENQYLTIKEAAAFLHVSAKTIRRQIKLGNIKTFLVGSRKRIIKATLSPNT